MERMVGLYTDYLLSGFGQSSATGLSRLLDNILTWDDIRLYVACNDVVSDEQVVAPLTNF